MEHMVCPWWLGYLLLNPLRRLIQDPDKVLGPYISEGMTVLDLGSGMGFFSLPLARMVGKTGRVICIDLQREMIAAVKKRAEKAGLSNNMETRLCRKDSLEIEDLERQVDFAIAFALAHEVPDKERFFSEICKSMKVHGKLLLAEPKGHVPKQEFDITVSIAQSNHFEAVAYPAIARSRAVLFQRR
jgi:ubiquinone/menaquinone biosynthesis C-methylase UbiE